MWDKAEKVLQKDKFVGPLIKKYDHCTINPRPKSKYFEDLVDAITGQQLSGKAATTIFNRVKEKCGRKLAPEKLLGLSVEQLRSCGLSYAKCAYVHDLAQRVKNGRLKVKVLDKLSDEEISKELVAVKGIGQWTADMFLMFTLARPDVFPSLDLGIKNGVKKLTGKDLKPKELAEFGLQFVPYRSVASWYIWQNLDNQ
jgi:DNA-3-methyladenine glycosylase II